jgi:hypothetical protein
MTVRKNEADFSAFLICGISRNAPTKPQISARFHRLIQSRKVIPQNAECSQLSREIKQSFKLDLPKWCSEKANEMEIAYGSANTQKLSDWSDKQDRGDKMSSNRFQKMERNILKNYSLGLQFSP